MKTMTLCVGDSNDKKLAHHISFRSIDLLWETIAGTRLQILKAMIGAGPMALRALARRIDRDVKGVHRDVHKLINAGLINRTESGAIVLPYDRVRVKFRI